MKLEIDPLQRQRTSDDTSHDRLCVLRDPHRTLIALADGADSQEAAQTAAGRTVAELARCFRGGVLPEDPRDWVMILEGIDHAVLADSDAGETSALVMLVQQGVVMGASVGGSLAYVARAEGKGQLLSPGAQKSPRIGTGLASPAGFGPFELDGKLITRRPARVGAPRLAPIAANRRLPEREPLDRRG
ncbi:MAG: hypothetical protein HKN10_17385 [Myxococcales bacterium]|nr:hypothetical protein [Myxococcales bacterium]